MNEYAALKRDLHICSLSSPVSLGVAMLQLLVLLSISVEQRGKRCATGMGEAIAVKDTSRGGHPHPSAVLWHTVMCTMRVSLFNAWLTTWCHPMLVALCDWLEISQRLFFLLVGLTLHSAIVASYCLFFHLCNSRGWLAKYKIPRTKGMKNPPALERQAYKRIVTFHGAVRVILGVTLCSLAPYPDLHQPLESFWMLWWHYVMLVLLGEIAGYVLHFTMHKIPFLYRLHKVHHEFHSPIAATTEYSHWAELIFYTSLNYLSTVEKPMTVHFVVILWRMTEAFESHCGYSFRGTWLSNIGLLNSYHCEFHDFHHSHNLGAYGNNLFMDFLFGTADEFVRYQEAQGLDVLGYRAGEKNKKEKNDIASKSL